MKLEVQAKVSESVSADIRVKTVEVNLAELEVTVAGMGGGTTAETYQGPYVVIPEIIPQTLATRDRLMEDNVTINSIPYYDVSNEKGRTIIIGGTT